MGLDAGLAELGATAHEMLAVPVSKPTEPAVEVSVDVMAGTAAALIDAAAAAYSENSTHSDGCPVSHAAANDPSGHAPAAASELADPSGAAAGFTASSGREGMSTTRSAAPAQAGETLTGEHVQDIFSLARHNRIREVTALLDRGVPVDIRDKFGNTILIVACQNGLKRMAKLALRRGCDIDARNLKGNTALHFCHAYGYGSGLGAYLVEKGSDESVRNSAGFLPHEGLG